MQLSAAFVSSEASDARRSQSCSAGTVRDLQPFRDVAQQGTVVTRMPPRAKEAAKDVSTLFEELALSFYGTPKMAANT